MFIEQNSISFLELIQRNAIYIGNITYQPMKTFDAYLYVDQFISCTTLIKSSIRKSYYRMISEWNAIIQIIYDNYWSILLWHSMACIYIFRYYISN